MIKRFQNYPWLVDVPNEIEGFDCLNLRQFYRDDLDWTDPDTGEFFPAPMDYKAMLTARRIRDGVYFYVRVVLDKDFEEKSPEYQTATLRFKIQNAIAFLQTFTECACTPILPCPSHPKGPNPSVAF